MRRWLECVANEEDAIEQLTATLWRDRSPNDVALIRALVEHVIPVRRRESGCGDALYALCFLLHHIGDPEDAFLIHAAKRANMDCGVMIDHDLLTMRRPRGELLAHVASRLAEEPELRREHGDIEQDIADAFDRPNCASPSDLDELFENYFREWH